MQFEGITYSNPSAWDAFAGTTNYACNPLFITYTEGAAENGDFHLQSGDTCVINAGADLSVYFTTDKDGITRPQGSAWDIGPYEYISASSTCSQADTNTNNIVDIVELMNYISEWKTGSITMVELMTGISEWKNGC